MNREDGLFYIPQYRETLLDRITNAYFKREDKPRPADRSAVFHRHTKPPVKPPGKNPAPERLYRNALRLAERKASAMNESAQKRAEKELAGCSFKPSLSDLSMRLPRKNSSALEDSRLRPEARFEQLYQDAEKTSSKLDRKRKQQALEECLELQETPTINPLSRLIVEERRCALFGKENSLDASNMLHEESKFIEERRKLRQLEQERKYPFKPEINRRSDGYIRLLGKNFYQRIEEFTKVKSERRNVRLKLQQDRSLFDQHTGQPFFQPIISEKSRRLNRSTEELSKPRQSSDVSIGESRIADQHSNSKNESVRMTKRTSTQSNPNIAPTNKHNCLKKTLLAFQKPPLSNQQSKQMNQKREEAVLESMFGLLDSDEDGVISSAKICIDSIPVFQLRMISPVLFELEELNQTLTLEEFKDAVGNLLKTLTPQERHLFYFGQKEQARDANLTFQPKINPLSRLIAEEKRPYGSSELFDHYIEEREQFLEKNRIKKIDQENTKLLGCTFYPNLRKYNAKKESRLSKSICSGSTGLGV